MHDVLEVDETLLAQLLLICLRQASHLFIPGPSLAVAVQVNSAVAVYFIFAYWLPNAAKIVCYRPINARGFGLRCDLQWVRQLQAGELRKG